MKKIVLTLSLLIASVSFVNATNVEPNTKKQDEPVKKEKLQGHGARACRYYAIGAASDDGWEYASPAWQYAYLQYYRSCMSREAL